ncbi:GNAT family N-acetyltransferase [Pseudohaliea sp.]|uniref:GNAT family N-acetyltransferase n=1 Tax=Pseudohaliea sp. TaxID=2740289 RepID=UPI0032EF79A0
MNTSYSTQPLHPNDRADWQPLFEGYAAFYEVPVSKAIIDRVWNWLQEPSHPVEGLLARDSKGVAQGLVHFRACPRPLGGCYIGFVDDMFVSPYARGTGVADAMFDALAEIAACRAWPEIRWVTQHFNDRARRFYDRYSSGPSDFIMYRWNQ